MRTRKDVIDDAVHHLVCIGDNINDVGYELARDEKELVNFLIRQDINGALGSYNEEVGVGEIEEMIASHNYIISMFKLMV